MSVLPNLVLALTARNRANKQNVRVPRSPRRQWAWTAGWHALKGRGGDQSDRSLNVSPARMSPVCNPRRNQRARCSLLPCVNESGTT